MATIKVLLDLRRAKSDGSFNIIFRITNLKKVYTINPGISLQKYFWNETIKAMLSGKPQVETPDTFQVFADKIIQQMREANRVGNVIVYQTAVNRLISYCGRDVTFLEIHFRLLDQFSHHLITSGFKQNSVSNYFRSIRAIYNEDLSIKIFILGSLPFLCFKINRLSAIYTQ